MNASRHTPDFTPEDITASPARLVRATLPPGAVLSRYQYLRTYDGAWVTFEEATRFPAGTDETDTPKHPHPNTQVQWVDDLPRDLDGWPFDPNDGAYMWRLTRCCAAGTSINDGPLYCKACFAEQPLDADTPPRLGPDWAPGNGPMTIRLD